jgi:hypothetical protein
VQPRLADLVGVTRLASSIGTEVACHPHRRLSQSPDCHQ